MDAQPKTGVFGCFKRLLQIPFFLMQFHKAQGNIFKTLTMEVVLKIQPVRVFRAGFKGMICHKIL